MCYKGGHNAWTNICYQVLYLTPTSSVTQPRQLALHSYPCCLALCGSAAPGERHCRTWATTLLWLKWSLGARGIYTFPLPLQHLSSLSELFSSPNNRKVLISLSPPLVTLSSQASPLISPSILERKRFQTRLESRSTDSQSLKSTSCFGRQLYLLLLELGSYLARASSVELVNLCGSPGRFLTISCS